MAAISLGFFMLAAAIIICRGLIEVADAIKVHYSRQQGEFYIAGSMVCVIRFNKKFNDCSVQFPDDPSRCLRCQMIANNDTTSAMLIGGFWPFNAKTLARRLLQGVTMKNFWIHVLYGSLMVIAVTCLYFEATTTAGFLALGVWFGFWFTLWKTGRLDEKENSNVSQ